MAESFEADVIIVGAGTAGLLLASELSSSSNLKIHIIEAGDDHSGHPDLQNVAGYQANLGSERDWQYESVPQAGFNGRTATQNSGKLLGGSSSINGGYYVAPSRAGVSAWSKLGNPSWSYDALEKACLDTVQIHPLDSNLANGLGLEEATAKTQGTGPVHVTAGMQDHPIIKAYFSTLKSLGCSATTAVFNDHSAVAQPLYYTHDPNTSVRTDANAAYAAGLRQSSNVRISLNTTVKRVILQGKAPNVTAKGVEVVTSTGESQTYLASREVVLSAGTLATPKILELSGIGQPDLLRKHNIPVVIENPNVGEGLRNHVMTAVHCELNGDVPPVAPGLLAMSFLASKDQPGLTETLSSYDSSASDDATYDKEVIKIFLDPNEGSCCHFMGFLGVPNAYSFGIISAIPFSHGSAHIASADPTAHPTIDPAFYSHPLDLELMSRNLVTASNLVARSDLAPYFKLDEHKRPANATTFTAENLDVAKEYLRAGTMTTYHATGTAAMRKREDRGVVDEQLKVHDTANLRVVDASVIPVLAHGNPMAAVYGVAKIAAEKMKASVESK